MIEQRPELFLALAQGRFFAVFAFGDVEHRTDIAEKLAVRPEPRVSRIDHPAVVAVVPAQAIIAVKRQALLIRIHKHSPSPLAILGMNRVEPAEAILTEPLLFTLAGKLVPPSREKRARAVRFGDPQHGRSGIGQIMEAFFALAQCFGDSNLSGRFLSG